MYKVSFDSDVNDKVISTLNVSIESLNSEIRNKLLVDFAPFTQVNLFSTQLNTLKTALDNLEKSCESLKSAIEKNKSQWSSVDEEVGSKVNNVNGGGNYNNNSSNNGGNSNYSNSDNMTSINSTVSINTSDVSNFITKIDDNTTIALLKRLFKLKGNTDMTSLLVDASMSGTLLVLLKKILGDTNEDLSTVSTAESDAIQKALLSKINKDKVDVTTEDGKSKIEKVILEKVNDKTVDESKLTEALYGNNTVVVDMLDGSWVVTKTASDLKEYASYVSSNKVSQTADTSKYGDSCLSFSYSHAYDMFKGTRTNTASAGNYAHAGSFTDFIHDDKQTVLNKIYDEIMKGHPLVLQVNGNKQGTSRHFVTVVGFRNGITSAENLTEKDLLIIDSWDGKVERMDTATSRFMTTGAACGKDYSGYRLQVLKDSVTA